MTKQHNWLKVREDHAIEQRRNIQRRLKIYREELAKRLPEHPWPDPTTMERAAEWHMARCMAWDWNRLMKPYSYLQVDIPETPKGLYPPPKRRDGP